MLLFSHKCGDIEACTSKEMNDQDKVPYDPVPCAESKANSQLKPCWQVIILKKEIIIFCINFFGQFHAQDVGGEVEEDRLGADAEEVQGLQDLHRQRFWVF